MRTLVLAAVLTAIGCGSGEATPREMLTGTWYLADGDTGLGLTFTDPETYVLQVARATSQATADVQVERGTFAWGDTEITFIPAEASCPYAITPVSAQYTVTPARLTLSGIGGGVSMVRAPTGNVGVALTFGCFYAEGFQPSPIARLPQ
jgi:hypothetical protein